MRRLFVVCGIVLCSLFCSSARAVVTPAKSGRTRKRDSVQGSVVDASGNAIPGAVVSLTDLATNQVVHTTSSATGQFVFNDVAEEPQPSSPSKSRDSNHSRRRFSPATQSTIAAKLQVAKLNDSVVVRGTVNPEAKPVPSREDVLLMPQTVRVLDRKQLDAAGPVAGEHRCCNTPQAPM